MYRIVCSTCIACMLMQRSKLTQIIVVLVTSSVWGIYHSLPFCTVTCLFIIFVFRFSTLVLKFVQGIASYRQLFFCSPSFSFTLHLSTTTFVFVGFPINFHFFLINRKMKKKHSTLSTIKNPKSKKMENLLFSLPHHFNY